MRQIILDTETTGLSPKEGHRLIEIGCVEMVGRRLTGNNFHEYVNPNRVVDDGAIAVHGITNEFLQDKPLFKEIAKDFIEYVQGAELIIHNAPFDVGFINHEFKLLNENIPELETICTVYDTLAVARKTYPGRKNSLDALCKRFEINNAHRTLHGALLDSEILAEVYLKMTAGQVVMDFGALEGDEPSALGKQSGNKSAGTVPQSVQEKLLQAERKAIKVVRASDAELESHDALLERIGSVSGEKSLWCQLSDV